MYSAILIQMMTISIVLSDFNTEFGDSDPDYDGRHSTTQVASYQEWVRVSGPCSWVGRNVVLYTFPTPLHTAQI